MIKPESEGPPPSGDGPTEKEDIPNSPAPDEPAPVPTDRASLGAPVDADALPPEEVRAEADLELRGELEKEAELNEEEKVIGDAENEGLRAEGEAAEGSEGSEGNASGEGEASNASNASNERSASGAAAVGSPGSASSGSGDARTSLFQRIVRALRAFDLIPRSPRPLPLRSLLPRGPAGWGSAILLWAVFLYYIRTWMKGNDELLFDPLFANDDVRTALFPFHNYTKERALTDDPISNEMKAYLMPAMWLLYRVLVPMTGLFWAPKVVQGLCFAVLAAAGWVLIRSRRAGLASATILIFLLLHTNFVINRLAGGFGRSFTFPLYALWVAGAISQSERARYTATVLGAVTQNYTVAILLGAEGIFSILDSLDKSRKVLFGRVKRYALLIAACVALILPYTIFQSRIGRVHTVEEAEKFPGFKARHRGELPFADPAPIFARNAVSPFVASGEKKLAPSWALGYEKHASTGPLVIVALLMLIGFARLGPPARPALAFFASTVVIYTLARVFAFRLYSVERYYAFGMPMVGVALAACGLGLIGPKLRPRWRPALRNLAAASFIYGLWALSGDGIVKKNGMTIDARVNASLYDFVKKLPINARILGHPFDVDDIPWWSGRATTGGFETVQFWLVEAARRAEVRTNDALRALYTTKKAELFAYARKYKVSHILVRKERYAAEFRLKAQSLEPFTAFTDKLLAGLELEDLALHEVPESAVVFQDRTFKLVDISLLGKAWQNP